MRTQFSAASRKLATARGVAMAAALSASAFGLSASPAHAAPITSPMTVVAGPFTIVASVDHVSSDAWRYTYAVTNNSVVSDYTGIPAWQYAWANGIDYSGLDALILTTGESVSFSEVAIPAPSFPGPVSDGTVDHYGYWDWTTWLGDGLNHGQFWGHEPMAIYPVGRTVTFSFIASPAYPGMGIVKLGAYRFGDALRHPTDSTQWFTWHEATLPVPVAIQTPSALVADAIRAGTLAGLGPNAEAAAGKLNAFVHMLADADAAVAAGDTAGACTALASAYSHSDGQPRPPDFVTGPATGQVTTAIKAEMMRLGCA